MSRQVITGDNWSLLMSDSMVNEDRGCDPEAVPTDCGTQGAIPYFVSYLIITGTLAGSHILNQPCSGLL